MAPFICLGIGIDDMFVITRCFDNVTEDEGQNDNALVKKVGLAMKHAGASITVTTLTDVCAFGIGGMTYFPSLKYFCICAVISITFIYLFQTSFFVAWMVLDQKRIIEKRNGFIPFIIHDDWQQPKWSQKDMSTIIASKVARIFEINPFRMFIIIFTMALLSFGIWGACQIKVEYDIKFLDEYSYLLKLSTPSYQNTLRLAIYNLLLLRIFLDVPPKGVPCPLPVFLFPSGNSHNMTENVLHN